MAVVAPLPYANPESVFILALAVVGPEVDTATPDPADFDGEAIRVLRTGGADDRRRDYPRLELAQFAQTYDRAVELGEACRTRMHSVAGESVALHDVGLLVIISYVETVTPPERIPTAPIGLVHDAAYYRAGLRRPLPLTAARAAAALNPTP